MVNDPAVQDKQPSRREALRTGAAAGLAALAALTTGCGLGEIAPLEKRIREVRKLPNGIYVFPPDKYEETLAAYVEQEGLDVIASASGYSGAHSKGTNVNSVVVVADIPATRLSETNMYPDEIAQVKEISPGLYQFPGNTFAEVLAEWRSQNPEKTIASINSNPGIRPTYTVILRKDVVPTFVKPAEEIDNLSSE